MQYASLDLIEAVVWNPLVSDPKAPTGCPPRNGGILIADKRFVYTVVAAGTVRSIPS
jgi:hypothetical protein